MDIDYVDANTYDFDARLYLKILVAIAKSDPDNGEPEYRYVRRQAVKLGLDLDEYWDATAKTFLTGRLKVSRLTALVIIKDALSLATLDGHFSLGEKERIYAYAQSFDIPRTDVDKVAKLLEEFEGLKSKWDDLVSFD
jgi:uncharacterized tellurite resistance protein B-like protein